ncbi:MAG: site-specific integrase [Rhodospirillales bacterium]|nr:site-specific integrase [Rhodospirillales bacterium]
MDDRPDEVNPPASLPPAIGELLPSAQADAAAPVTPNQALALVKRLARAHPPSAALQALLEGPLCEAVAAAADYAGDAISDATRSACLRDWAEFSTWCRGNGADPSDLPVNPVLVAAWLATLAATHGSSALGRRVAAIAWHHRRRGILFTAAHPVICETLSGIRRAHPRPVRPAAALTSVEIKQLIATCPSDLAGIRDRALLLVGFAGAFRRSELVAIDHAHLRFDANGVTIRIPRSKRDQEGKGADVTLPRMRGEDTGAVRDTCPVRALEIWLSRAKIRRGPVFRGITRHGTLEDRLSPGGVRIILLRRAALANLTVHPSERLSPHGLRAGLITEAYLAGAPDEQVAAHTRHGDLSTMRGYRRRARITADNPARLLDL